MHHMAMNKLSSPVTAEDHAKGGTNAVYTLVEYGDYQCPSCGQVLPLIQQVQKYFGDKLSFVFRNFPLTEIHENAEAAAETAEFAATKAKFWEMHDLLYKHQEELTESDLLGYANKLELDAAELKQALSAGTYKKRIDADLKSGEDSKVHGTPTFFINGVQYSGSYDAESLIQALES
jgi:protein-disulfide isomerase